MILRRVIEHVKAQNWTAVGLDFVIVVMGVFMGLQVQNWNEARKDHARERAYLVRIADELDESIVSIKRAVAKERYRARLGELLIRSVNDPEVVRSNPRRYVTALVQAGWTFSPTIYDYTFQEMRSNADLDVLRDVKLRSALLAFYANVAADAQWNYTREQMQNEYDRRRAGILTLDEINAVILAYENSSEAVGGGETIDVSLEEALAARDRMLDRPDFIEWLPQAASRVENEVGDVAYLKAAQELRERVCAAPSVYCGADKRKN